VISKFLPGSDSMTTDSPYAPPESELVDAHTSRISRKGRYIVFDPKFELPSRCFKCNQATNFKKDVKLTYVNPWIYVSILVTILLTIILALIFRKKFKVELPLCERHEKKRKNFQIFQWTMVALMVAGFAIGISTNSDVILGASSLIILIIIISALFGRRPQAARYRNEKIWITGSGKEFRNSLPDFIA
jgi:hypothetical protein